MIHKLFQLESRLRAMVKGCAVIFFVLGAVGYGLELALRFFGGKSLYWLSPWISYFFVIASLYGASYAVSTNENIKVEILRKWANHRSVKRAVNAFAFFVSLLILWVFYRNIKLSLGKGGFLFLADIPYLHLFLMTVFFYGVNIFSSDQSKKK